MPQRRIFVNRFRSEQPAYRVGQSQALNWLGEAHTQAESLSAAREGVSFHKDAFREKIQDLLRRYGCREDKISARASQNEDFTHTNWSEMKVFRLDETPQGRGATVRSRFFESATAPVFERLFADRPEPPGDIIHVTCTGYSSPSVAQNFVSQQGWGSMCRVTHAYHMGCYAAFPALRLASSLVQAPPGLRSRGQPRVDIVHTELCTLHLNPLVHTPEQLVVQSLFADGFIVYSLLEADHEPDGSSYELLALDEIVIPDSSESMSWVCSDWGMQMTLARDVPEKLVGSIRPFVDELFVRARLSEQERNEASYAIHPGGPKIVSGVQKLLGLGGKQVAHSRAVLFDSGNMSSATLPHVWERMLSDDCLPTGQAVLSLAFGPGLTLCGAVMRKVAA